MLTIWTRSLRIEARNLGKAYSRDPFNSMQHSKSAMLYLHSTPNSGTLDNVNRSLRFIFPLSKKKTLCWILLLLYGLGFLAQRHVRSQLPPSQRWSMHPIPPPHWTGKSQPLKCQMVTDWDWWHLRRRPVSWKTKISQQKKIKKA